MNMLRLRMKQHLVLTGLILSFFMLSCSHYKKKYDHITTHDYSNLDSAIQEHREFMEELRVEDNRQGIQKQPDVKNYLEDISLAKKEFEAMNELLSRDFSSLIDFNATVADNSSRFTDSRFETIRLSWVTVTNKLRTEQARRDLDLMTIQFSDYLESDVRQICSEVWSHFTINEDRRPQWVSLGEPYQFDDDNGRLGKVCEGTIRVHLKGAYFGFDKASVKIFVKGCFIVTEDESGKEWDVEYQHLDYSVIETEGSI
jgi:hypothetical protein